jgi:O-antigen/teichoic acid export membrane protein
LFLIPWKILRSWTVVMNALRSVVKNAAWMAGAQWGMQVLQFGVSIVLARLLIPSDYGLVSMSATFTGVVSLFASLGFGVALVERREVDDDCICTAFWSTAGVGVLAFALATVGAPLIGSFYGERRLVTIIQVAACGLIISPLNDIALSLLTRQMAFRAIASIEIVAALIAQATALIAAFTGFGVWSLVAATIVSQVARFLGFFCTVRWLPHFRFSRARFTELFSFSRYLVGYQLLNYFVRNLDNVLIGKVLGPVALGYYDLAYQLTLKPMVLVSSIFTQPLFPVLVSLKDDKKRAADTYRSVVVYISLITFPLLLGLASVAPEAVSCILGERWVPVVPTLQILCVVGLMNCIATTVGTIYLSQGRSDIPLKWILGVGPVAYCAFFIGIQWGIEGVAASYAVFTAVTWIISHAIANRLIELRADYFWSALMPATCASLLMVGAVLGARLLMSDWPLSMETKLFTFIAIGATVYCATVLRGKGEEIVKVREYLITKFAFS